MLLSGQVCASLTRIAVSRTRHDELVEALAASFSQVRVGDPFDAQTQMGPLAARRQRDRVEGYIARGLAASLPYALMAGNTVIVKPPPATPLSSVRTLRHLVRALPPGVLNVVTGADEVVGPVVVGDPRIKHVCFTGSVGGRDAAGQRTAAHPAQRRLAR